MNAISDISSVVDLITGKGFEQASHDIARFAVSTLDILSAHICVIDRTGTILMVNQAWRDYCDKNCPENPNYFLGFNYLETCDIATGRNAQGASAMAEGIRSVIDGERRVFAHEYSCNSAAGERWFCARVTNFIDNRDYAAITHENITGQKQAEQLLKASLSKVKCLEHALNEHALVTISDLEGKITDVNQKFCNVFKYSRREMLGKNLGAIESSTDSKECAPDPWAGITKGKVWKGEIVNRAKDGSLHWMDTTMVPIPDAMGAPCQIVAIRTDVTDRKKNEEALVALSNELRGLASHLENVKESERKRIARELHDELGQHLLSLKMDVAMLHARTANTHPRLNERLNLVLECIDGTMKTVKAIINDLRPAALDLGLSAAIQAHASAFERRTGIACELVMNDGNIELDNDRMTTLFRVVQESLVNVARHSQASKVRIALHRNSNSVSIHVSDNGTGIVLDGHKRRGKFGLVGMRERINAHGGKFSIEQEAGGGTKLTASVPI